MKTKPSNLPLFYITCPKGVETLIEQEFSALSMVTHKVAVGGVYCHASFDEIYRFCLYTRFANRVIWVMEQIQAASRDDLYHKLKNISFSGCFASTKTFAVEFRGTNRFIKNTNYGALLVKDAIADHFVEVAGRRPDVDVKSPDVKVWVQVKRQFTNVGIDLVGRSLHRRGYRLDGAKAPLKENLAAALAVRAGVDDEDTRSLIDPMCGSGTLLVESVLIKLNIAANLTDEKWVLQNLNNYKGDTFMALRAEAALHKQQVLQKTRVLAYGFDEDQRAINDAKANARRAGVADFIIFKHRSLKDFTLPDGVKDGLLLTNPPYGERLGEKQSLYPLYQQLGALCRENCQGFDVAVLSSDKDLTKALGLQKDKVYQFYNGPIPATWTLYRIHQRDHDAESASCKPDERFNLGVEMVKNRLLKNQKRLQKWVKREQIEAYRLYDADMPEYAFAVDYYAGFYHVSEYKAPKQIDEFSVNLRRQQFLKALKLSFNLSGNKVIVKQRQQQKGNEQYEKMDQMNHFFPVREGQVKALVNLYDYLDTGLFLDHRPVRRFIEQQAKGKRFLNLFAYTSVATLHAAKGGAASSVSVDMSKTYQHWSLRNFKTNGLDIKNHRLINDNCLSFVKDCQETFDLIFLDPPSFSNSKKMMDTFDVQRDHEQLIKETMALLNVSGTLIFSNNRRGFKLSEDILKNYDVKNYHRESLDPDFIKRENIHNCWLIKHIELG